MKIFKKHGFRTMLLFLHRGRYKLTIYQNNDKKKNYFLVAYPQRDHRKSQQAKQAYREPEAQHTLGKLGNYT